MKVISWAGETRSAEYLSIRLLHRLETTSEPFDGGPETFKKLLD